MFQGEEVSVSERFQIGTDDVTQSLTIANVSLKDRGPVSYFVETASTEATLLVEGLSDTSLSQQIIYDI